MNEQDSAGQGRTGHRSRATAVKTDVSLLPAVGLWSQIAVSVNGIVGAGIFVLPAAVARQIGPLVPLAASGLCVWLFAGLSGNQMIAGALALAAGVVLYGLRRVAVSSHPQRRSGGHVGKLLFPSATPAHVEPARSRSSGTSV